MVLGVLRESAAHSHIPDLAMDSLENLRRDPRWKMKWEIQGPGWIIKGVTLICAGEQSSNGGRAGTRQQELPQPSPARRDSIACTTHMSFVYFKMSLHDS